MKKQINYSTQAPSGSISPQGPFPTPIDVAEVMKNKNNTTKQLKKIEKLDLQTQGWKMAKKFDVDYKTAQEQLIEDKINQIIERLNSNEK